MVKSPPPGPQSAILFGRGSSQAIEAGGPSVGLRPTTGVPVGGGGESGTHRGETAQRHTGETATHAPPTRRPRAAHAPPTRHPHAKSRAWSRPSLPAPELRVPGFRSRETVDPVPRAPGPWCRGAAAPPGARGSDAAAPELNPRRPPEACQARGPARRQGSTPAPRAGPSGTPGTSDPRRDLTPAREILAAKIAL